MGKQQVTVRKRQASLHNMELNLQIM